MHQNPLDSRQTSHTTANAGRVEMQNLQRLRNGVRNNHEAKCPAGVYRPQSECRAAGNPLIRRQSLVQARRLQSDKKLLEIRSASVGDSDESLTAAKRFNIDCPAV